MNNKLQQKVRVERPSTVSPPARELAAEKKTEGDQKVVLKDLPASKDPKGSAGKFGHEDHG
jgi:hypothetical protein